MRNLKRALSLALASIMVLGLMVVGSSAASYTDVTDEHNTEAIEVLQSVTPAVMEGTGDGKFEPEKELTRNEMAVIMCRLLDYTVASYKGTSPFTDVPAGHWAEEYVSACYTNKIIAGMGNNYFGGDEIVTTGQAALMILKALGYFQEPGDFGSDWLVETVRVGSQIGLFDDITNGAREALTRNDAAQICLNALESDMVEITSHDLAAGASGALTTKAVYTARTSSNGAKYNAIGKDYNATTGKYTIQLGEDLYDGDLKKADGTSDDFGRPSTQWKFVNDEIGLYADAPKATFQKKVTAVNIYDVIGKSVTDDLRSGAWTLRNNIDGVECYYNPSTDVMTAASQIATGKISEYSNKNDTTKVNGSGNGMLTEVYVDNDARTVTIVSINTYVYQAVDDYSSSKDSVTLTPAGDTNITLTDNELDGDDFEGLEDIKENDYLLVTVSRSTLSGRYDVQTVQKAEILTGEVTGYTVEDSVSIDGKSYGYSLTAMKDGDAGHVDGVKSTGYTVGQDAAVVLDAYGYVICVDEAMVSSNYVYVSEFGRPSGLSTGKVVANAYFTDGTNQSITVKEAYISGSLTSNSTTILGIPDISGNYTQYAGWYTYSTNSNGEYSLLSREAKYVTADKGGYDQATNADVMFNNKVKFLGTSPATSFTNAVTGFKANDKTLVIVNDDDDDVSVFTGVKNLPEIVLGSGGKADVSLIARSDGYAYYVFVDVTGSASISGGEDEDLVYFVKFDGTQKAPDSTTYYTYKVLDGTSEKVVKADSKNIDGGANNIYKVQYKLRYNADDEITSAASVTTGGKFVSASGVTTPITYRDGGLTINGNGYTFADDYRIILVVRKTANALNNDKEAAYEASSVTASGLYNQVKNCSAINYDFAAKVTENGGTVIEDMYVTVNTATLSTTGGGGGGGGGGASGDVPAGTGDGTSGSGFDETYTMYYYGTAPDADAIKAELAESYGVSVTSYNNSSKIAVLSDGWKVKVAPAQVFKLTLGTTVLGYANGTKTLTLAAGTLANDGYYLKKVDNLAPMAAGGITTTSVDLTGNAGFKAGATGGTTGIKISADTTLVPAYTVTGSGSLSSNLTYKDGSTDKTLTDGYLVVGGTSVSVTGAATSGYTELTMATNGNDPVAVDQAKERNASDKKAKYTVNSLSGNVVFAETAVYEVTIGGVKKSGTHNGFWAEDEKVSFEAPVAKIAYMKGTITGHKVESASVSAATPTGAITYATTGDNLKLAEYTVKAADATSNKITLTPMVKVAATSVTIATAAADGVGSNSVADGDYLEWKAGGYTLTLTGTLNGAKFKAAVNEGSPADFDGNDTTGAEYKLADTTYDVAFTIA